MDTTFAIEYDSADAVTAEFIERISLEMKKLGVFNFKASKEKKASPSAAKKADEEKNQMLEQL